MLDTKRWKTLLPLLVVLLSLAAAWAIMANRPVLEQPSAPEPVPSVTVLKVQPQRLRLNVHSQGIVTPRMEIDLVAEVAGKVVRLHPSFVAGGFFKRDEVLLSVDARDYELAITQAQAHLAEAQHRLAFEQAQAEQAQSEWQALGEGQPTPLSLHVPQLAEARAKLKAAQADLLKAQLQRNRCELRAAFAGRVREKSVGLGQHLLPGEKLARLYSIDSAEVRLPLSPGQLAFIDVPIGLKSATAGPKVSLRAEFAGANPLWEGRIIRSEAAMDEATGLLHVVAEVRTPYAANPPLLAGLFVQAEIEGREREGVFVLPVGAVNSAEEVWLVDADERLRIRKLDILRHEPDRILVQGGLQAGERVVTSSLQTPVEGMKLRVEGTDAGLEP